MKTKTGLVINIRRGDSFIWGQSQQGLKKYNGALGTVVDIGAHVGCFSLAAAQMGAKRVWAFEPVGDNYSRLVENIVRNNFWGRIIPMPFAVFNYHLKMAQIGKARNSGQYSLHYKEMYPTQLCTTYHLGELGRHLKHIDYLKIDIEGAEWGLFAQPEIDPLLKKVSFLDLEIHDLSNKKYFKMLEGETRGSMRKKLQDKLLQHGFADVAIGGEPLGIRSVKANIKR